MKLAKRLEQLETRSFANEGYWVRLIADPQLGETQESVIAEYEAANGHDPDRHYVVWQLVDPKDWQPCA